MLLEFFSYKQNFYRLYRQMFSPLLETYHLTQMEMDILLFLTNNPEYDTAADIVNVRHLAKSHVSSSVEKLVQKGYLARFFHPGDRKRIHLKCLPAAQEVIQAGKQTQHLFFTLLFQNISRQDIQTLFDTLRTLNQNVNDAYRQLGHGQMPTPSSIEPDQVSLWPL